MNHQPGPGAVVVGAHANGLGIVRALGTRDIPVAVVTTRPFDMAQHSRWVSETHTLPTFHEQPSSLVDFLERHRDRWGGWGVFPTNDDALTALAQAHARLSATYRIVAEPWSITSQFADKGHLHELATRAGLDVPHCYGSATRETVEGHALRFPVVVKPLQHDRLISVFGAKLFLAHDMAELFTAIDRLEQAALKGLIFDFIPGPDSDIFAYCVYVATSGDASPGVTIRKLRQYPATIGGACAAEVVPDLPGLREATLALVTAAGFHGIVFAEFKRHAHTGRLQFIEVNGRAVLFNSLPRMAGLDLVGMAWDDIVLGRPGRTPKPRSNATWVHVQADALAAWGPKGTRPSFGALVAPYLRPARDAVWSWTDPMPFIAQSARAFQRVVGLT